MIDAGSPPLTDAVLGRAEPDDAAEVLVLQRCCWVSEAILNDTLAIPALHEDLDTVRAWIAEQYVWILRRAGRLVAGVRARHQDDRWEIGRLMVAPDLAGRGVGRWLLEHAEAQAPADVTSIDLFTGGRSERNLRLYRRAGYARHEPPSGELAQHIQGQLPAEPARPDLELRVSTGRDGTYTGRFRFADPEAAATLRAAIEAYTPDPEPDPTLGTRGRSLAERHGAALDAPTVALLDGQWPLPAETARRLACDAEIIPAVLGSRGETLDLGRRTRIVTTARRRALIARDHHCAHPGCRRRPRHCRAHHLTPCAHQGATTPSYPLDRDCPNDARRPRRAPGYGGDRSQGVPMLDLVERLRAASLGRDARRLADLYAPDGVHEFPFVTPGAPTRVEGRAAIEEFNAMVFAHLPFAYREYRTVAIRRAGATVVVVEQEAIGTNTVTGVPFALPNVWIIEVDEAGLIVRLRDYVNPVAVAEALGDVPGALSG